MHFEVFKRHNVVAAGPFARGIAEKHLVLVGVDEVSEDFVAEAALLLNGYFLGHERLRLGENVRATFGGLRPFLALLKHFNIVLVGEFIFLLLCLLFFVFGVILYFVHLLFDFVHTQTFF